MLLVGNARFSGKACDIRVHISGNNIKNKIKTMACEESFCAYAQF